MHVKEAAEEIGMESRPEAQAATAGVDQPSVSSRAVVEKILHHPKPWRVIAAYGDARPSFEKFSHLAAFVAQAPDTTLAFRRACDLLGQIAREQPARSSLCRRNQLAADGAGCQCDVCQRANAEMRSAAGAALKRCRASQEMDAIIVPDSEDEGQRQSTVLQSLERALKSFLSEEALDTCPAPPKRRLRLMRRLSSPSLPDSEAEIPEEACRASASPRRAEPQPRDPLEGCTPATWRLFRGRSFLQRLRGETRGAPGAEGAGGEVEVRPTAPPRLDPQIQPLPRASTLADLRGGKAECQDLKKARSAPDFMESQSILSLLTRSRGKRLKLSRDSDPEGRGWSPVKRPMEPPEVIDCFSPEKSPRGAPARQEPTVGPDVALVIKKRWCDKIFDGGKVWEIRGSWLKKRGRICIAQSKSKTLVGEVTVVGCLKVGRWTEDGQLVPWSDAEQDRQSFIGAPENLAKHCVEDLSLVKGYPRVFAWVLERAERYATPVPYQHKVGCITWVKLHDRPAEAAPKLPRSQLPRQPREPRGLRPLAAEQGGAQETARGDFAATRRRRAKRVDAGLTTQGSPICKIGGRRRFGPRMRMMPLWHQFVSDQNFHAGQRKF
ncbi:unnamed protein product [Effrenium voratum]|nr:unnamed protein product [Effrenium voratum]